MIVVDILMAVVLVFVLSVPILLLWAICSDDQYVPMSPDEEVEWLVQDHNMTREEAEKLVDRGYWED